MVAGHCPTQHIVVRAVAIATPRGSSLEINSVECIGDPDVIAVGLCNHGCRYGAPVFSGTTPILPQVFRWKVGTVPHTNGIPVGDNCTLQYGQPLCVDVAVSTREGQAQHVDGGIGCPIEEVSAEFVRTHPAGLVGVGCIRNSQGNRLAHTVETLEVGCGLRRDGRLGRVVVVVVCIASFSIVVAKILFCITVGIVMGVRSCSGGAIPYILSTYRWIFNG